MSESITVTDLGLRARPDRYRAEVWSVDGSLAGRPASSPAKAKANLLEDALAIASFERTRVAYGDGGYAEVSCEGVGSYSVQSYRADGTRGSSMGTSDLTPCLRESGRLGAFRGGVASISINAYGRWAMINQACADETAAQVAA